MLSSEKSLLKVKCGQKSVPTGRHSATANLTNASGVDLTR